MERTMRITTVKTSTLILVLGALFMALAIIMPFITGQIPEVGSMLLPMHLPVLICGFVWLEIRIGSGICGAAASKRDVWNAAAHADRVLYGV